MPSDRTASVLTLRGLRLLAVALGGWLTCISASVTSAQTPTIELTTSGCVPDWFDLHLATEMVVSHFFAEGEGASPIHRIEIRFWRCETTLVEIRTGEDSGNPLTRSLELADAPVEIRLRTLALAIAEFIATFNVPPNPNPNPNPQPQLDPQPQPNSNSIPNLRSQSFSNQPPPLSSQSFHLQLTALADTLLSSQQMSLFAGGSLDLTISHDAIAPTFVRIAFAGIGNRTSAGAGAISTLFGNARLEVGAFARFDAFTLAGGAEVAFGFFHARGRSARTDVDGGELLGDMTSVAVVGHALWHLGHAVLLRLDIGVGTPLPGYRALENGAPVVGYADVLAFARFGIGYEIF